MSLAASRRAEISAIVENIQEHAAYFRDRHIDVSEPGDREALDIINRIGRQILAASSAKEPAE